MDTFDLDFKKMIVDLFNSGESVSKISRDYDVVKATIYKWKKELSPLYKSDELGSVVTNLEYLKLQKEFAKLKEENDILKKCVTIFLKK